MTIIAHIADIHIKNIDRHKEYQQQFEKLYKIIQENKVNIVAIVGDLMDNFIEISNEAKIIAGEFLNKLSTISDEIILVPGNHDLRKKNLNRINSVETIVKLINNPKIIYFDKSGFFDDNISNIVWVNHSHLEKKINPWVNIPHTIDKSKIYIDLFHDPINGCSTDVGKIFNDIKLRSIDDFKGSASLLGDIHLHQALGKNNNIVYPSSLIQQNFGENIDHHGCVIWNINSKNDISWKFINIENDFTFVNLYVDELTDYDNLNLNAPNSKDVDITVHWKDYSSNITTLNEKKIRDYIKNKFNATKIRFEKVRIYNDIISSKMLSESLDLTELQVQLTIFKEYLDEQKYKKEDIEEILKIDDIINSRLHLSSKKTNISWSIDKFWFSNFKSYGDNNEVEWRDIDGIIQINGLNTDGKTSILDAITYILYGKTTTTLSPEKFGDNRYINNKRFLDYCVGGAIIDVDGEKFVIQRRTDRNWNRNKTEITSCPTTLDFYKSEEISEKNKLTDEVKKKTQDQLDLILGDIKDFIRLSFTNADNLDDSLSETRSVFMDNIIRDAGYDIFETKLEEFKEYKKELSEEKLIVNIQESESDIADLKIEIDGLKEEILSNKKQIDEFETELKEHNKNRDELNKNLNNIDSSLSNFDENINLNSIENYKNKIQESKIQSTILENAIELLPLKFDTNKLNSLKIKLKDTNDKIAERKDEISNIKNLLTESNNKIDKVLSKIKELKDAEIKKLQLRISDNDLKIEVVKNQKENIINEEIRLITSVLQKTELEKNDISNKMKLLQKDGLNLKNANDELDKEIEDYKNSTTCPACGRDFEEGSDHLVHLQEKIDQLLIKKEDNNTKIQKFLSDYKKFKNLLPDLEQREETLNNEKNDLKQDIFSEDVKSKLKLIGSVKGLKQENLEIKEKIDEIKNNNFDNSPTLKENISKGNQILKNVEKNKNENLEVIKNIEFELKSFNIDGIENDIEIEERIRMNFELRGKKISQKDNLLLLVENFNFKIKELQSEIDKYQENKLKIEENKNTQFSINRIDEKILIVKENIKDLTQDNIDIEKDILIKETEINAISVKIKKYLRQKKKEELLKEYQKCISRDGLPTFLLKKSIHLINKELTDLLTNVDFTLFFDENLILRLSADDRLDVDQPAITSSGKERTFCALALKIALRQINVKSKPTFIFMDEIMGRLIGESVTEFTSFLEDLTTKVKKIIIIEHNHNINFNSIIEVKKDKNLISSLFLNF